MKLLMLLSLLLYGCNQAPNATTDPNIYHSTLVHEFDGCKLYYISGNFKAKNFYVSKCDVSSTVHQEQCSKSCETVTIQTQ